MVCTRRPPAMAAALSAPSRRLARRAMPWAMFTVRDQPTSRLNGCYRPDHGRQDRAEVGIDRGKFVVGGRALRRSRAHALARGAMTRTADLPQHLHLSVGQSTFRPSPAPALAVSVPVR